MKHAIHLLLLALAGCGETAVPQAGDPDELPPAAELPLSQQSAEAPRDTALDGDLMAQWARNCALCHVRGEGGAPTVGDREEWQRRLAQGEDALLAHTVEGLNNMPPLGYCMSCEEADFRRLIRFMAGES